MLLVAEGTKKLSIPMCECVSRDDCQAGSEKDYGMTSIDLGVNNLKVSLADYFGNTAAACKIELPASGRVPLTGSPPLQKQMCHVLCLLR